MTKVINVDAFLTYLVVSKFIDNTACEEIKAVIDHFSLDAIPIPDNATRGYMITTMFPDATIIEEDGCIGIDRPHDSILWFDPKWWNAKYKEEKDGEGNQIFNR